MGFVFFCLGEIELFVNGVVRSLKVDIIFAELSL
jgi:hypothetical protein